MDYLCTWKFNTQNKFSLTDNETNKTVNEKRSEFFIFVRIILLTVTATRFFLSYK